MGLNNPGGIKGVKIPICPVVNGGFETGDFTGWIIGAWGNSAVQVVANGHPGTYAAKIVVWNTAPSSNAAYIKQSINCVPTGLHLHFDYKASATGGLLSGGGGVLLLDAADYPGEYWIALPLSASWTSYSIEWPSEVTGMPITIKFYAHTFYTHSQTVTFYIDNVRFV